MLVCYNVEWTNLATHGQFYSWQVPFAIYGFAFERRSSADHRPNVLRNGGGSLLSCNLRQL